jgi:NTE family protein
MGSVLLLVSGCASYGVVENTPGDGVTGDESYSIKTFMEQWRTSENAIMLAFSGGGTRAAAFSYGVLKELRETPIVSGGQNRRLLDEVHTISSVSGGSFTAAYYGLHGEGIFDDFEEVFLRKNVEGALIRGLFNPLLWFSSGGRTEMAVDYYEEQVFKGATFADMKKQDGPMIAINASDLGYGVRFSFVQEYFNLLCSDLSSFPVARAVTASSAVPVLFPPVVARNYSECGSELPDFLKTARIRAKHDPELALTVEGLETFYDRDKRQYAHFVDGGITDNLGLRAIYDVYELAGGVEAFARIHKRQPPRRLVIIAVNASTEPEPEMDQSNKQPSLGATISAMSDVQLHRYNVATVELLKQSLERWAQALSTPDNPVEPYFIRLNFKAIADPERRNFLNQTPTSFRLSDEQVDQLIEAGGELLRSNPEFRRLVSDLEADGSPGGAATAGTGSLPAQQGL